MTVLELLIRDEEIWNPKTGEYLFRQREDGAIGYGRVCASGAFQLCQNTEPWHQKINVEIYEDEDEIDDLMSRLEADWEAALFPWISVKDVRIIYSGKDKQALAAEVPDILYKRYQLEWLIESGHFLPEVLEQEDFLKNGINGHVIPSSEEFLKNEALESGYVYGILLQWDTEHQLGYALWREEKEKENDESNDVCA